MISKQTFGQPNFNYEQIGGVIEFKTQPRIMGRDAKLRIVQKSASSSWMKICSKHSSLKFLALFLDLRGFLSQKGEMYLYASGTNWKNFTSNS